MLLQGAAVVRFANRFLNEFKDKQDFVLVAMFIEDDGKVVSYSLFERPNDTANRNLINPHKRCFDMNKLDGRIRIARQLYNILHFSERDSDDTKVKIAELKKVCSGIARSFHTKDPTMKSNNHTRTHTSASDGNNLGADPGSAIEHTILQGRGYEVEPHVIVDDMGATYELLGEKLPHIFTVYRSSNRNEALIAKKVREKSNELEILEFLNTIHPKSQHIILLVDSFRTQTTSWVILPKLSSVADFLEFSPDKLSGKVAQLCCGLIDGLAYLHKHCIAHRDIKPDNLLVDHSLCMKIIDFDIAMKVKDENEEVDDQCGTEHWIAPEVERRWTMYSPIKADRWSCGHVLQRLLDKLQKQDKFFIAIAEKLKAQDPNERPSLVELRNSFPAMSLVFRRGQRDSEDC